MPLLGGRCRRIDAVVGQGHAALGSVRPANAIDAAGASARPGLVVDLHDAMRVIAVGGIDVVAGQVVVGRVENFRVKSIGQGPITVRTVRSGRCMFVEYVDGRHGCYCLCIST